MLKTTVKHQSHFDKVMQKFFDILLLKFIDDKSYRSVMTAIMLFTIMYAINLDRKHAAEMAQVTQQIVALDNIRLQLFANEAKQNADMMYDTWLLISEQNSTYRRTLLDKLVIEGHTHDLLNNQINSIDMVIKKQLSLIKVKSETSQEYYKLLINNKLNKVQQSLSFDGSTFQN